MLPSRNFRSEGRQRDQTLGEVAWNHMFQHPKTYSVSQMSAGMVTDTQAAGRVFCDFGNGLENFVWTQDDGHLLGYVAGPVVGTFVLYFGWDFLFRTGAFQLLIYSMVLVALMLVLPNGILSLFAPRRKES